MHSIRLSVALISLLGSLGCGKKNGAPTTEDSKPKELTGTPALPTAAGNTGEASAATLKAATDFAKGVQDGKATSAMLTTAFKKVIAPPELDADKAAGYSEHGVQIWLTAAKVRIGTEDVKPNFITEGYAFASSVSPSSAKTFLRLMLVEKQWLVDYVIFSGASAKPLPPGDQAPPFFGTLAFAEALATKNYVQIEGLLTKTAKAKLAPPLFDGDKEQGFSRSKLHTALDELFSGKVAVDNVNYSGGTGMIVADFRGAMHSIQVWLVPGRPGEFLIDAFTLAQQK